jgi:hypothetical protein
MFFDNNGKLLLEKKEFVYLTATIAAVIAAILYEIYERRKRKV